MTNQKSWIKALHCAFVIGTVTLTAGGVISLKAQGLPGTISGNPFSEVLAKLDQVLAILTAPLGSGPVLLSTPAVVVTPALQHLCSIANVGTTPIANVLIRQRDFTGTVLLTEQVDLPVGESRLLQNQLVSGSGVYRCEFSFEGTAAAVRANVTSMDRQNVPLVSADAR